MIFFVLISAFSFMSKEEPVAVVGDKKVFEKDIPKNLSLEQHLKNIVFFELAKEKGYDDSVKTHIEQRFNQEIVRRTINKFRNSASEPTVYECALFYINSKKKIEAQLIQTRGFGQALKAYVEVLRGEDFGAVSEKYSFSPGLRKSKGLLERPIAWSADLPLPFGLVFNMKKGEVSPPIKYGTTWVILKILDVKVQGGENAFDRRKMMEEIADPRFRRHVFGDKVTLYNFRLQRLIPWIANVKIDSEGLSLLVTRISAWEEKSMGGGNPFREEDLGVVLATGTIGEYTIGSFIEDIARVGDLSAFANKVDAATFVRDNMLDKIVVAICKRLGVQRDPSLLKAYEESIRNFTIDFFKSKEILSVIKENEDDLKAFYENNKDKYIVAERRRVSLIEVKEKEEAGEVRKRLLKGESFEVLAQEVSIGRGSRKGGGIGYIEKGQRGAVGEEAFLLRKGEISKNFETKRGWAIIKVTDIKKSYLPDYSTVKSSVRTDYRKDKASKIENQIFDQNKEKFGLKLFN